MRDLASYRQCITLMRVIPVRLQLEQRLILLAHRRRLDIVIGESMQMNL